MDKTSISISISKGYIACIPDQNTVIQLTTKIYLELIKSLKIIY